MEITTKIECINARDYYPQDRLIKTYRKRSNILEMSFDTFKTCVDRIPQDVDIHFSGMCEPWLNKDCTKTLMYSCKRGYNIFVFTTLVGMKPSDINSIESVLLKSFMVDLPSNEPGKFIKAAISKKYWQTILKFH